VEVPTGWWTSDITPAALEKDYHTVLKSNDARSGEHALMLKSLNASPDHFMAGGQMGFNINSNNNPTHFSGYYKSTLDSTDSFFIYVYLYKKNGANAPDLVGYIFNRPPATASTYTSFSIPITYLSTETADSAVVAFSTMQSGSNTTHTVLLDDLSFSSPSGLSEGPFLQELSVYPNPTRGRSVVAWKNKTAVPVSVTLLDIMGRPVKQLYAGTQTGGMRVEIDLNSYPAGMYFIEAVSNEGRQLYKLIKY
jgi:hypothetical protein